MTDNKREKVLLFYNPNSGNGLFKNNIDAIVEKFQGANLQVVPVRAARGHAIEQAMAEMDQSQYRQVIVAGGDGTINVCVNTMINNDINLPLAIFPAGTANDFATYFGIPQDIDGMIDVALGNSFTYADVGKCNSRYFVNVAAMGSLIDVSQKTDSNLKNTLGVFSYYLKAATEIVKLHTIPIKLITPEKIYNEKMYFMVVMNGKGAGGFKKIAPDSDINDGLLEVVLFRKMPIYELGQILFSVISGTHPQHKRFCISRLLSLELSLPKMFLQM